MNVIPSNKGKTYPAEMLNPDEIRLLLRACNRGPTGHRSRALIMVLWRAGLRISEALDLQIKDIDFTNNLLHVLRGKGRKQRMAAIDLKALEFLKYWIVLRSKQKRIVASGSNFIFCTMDGERITTAQIRSTFPRLARIAGIEKRVHAHAFRHTHAVELLYERVAINQISRQLGHSNIATTSTYLSHVSDPDLANIMRARPMAKSMDTEMP